MLSTSGGVLINSSGGIIELNATNKGEVIFNSGSFNLNTTLNFAPPDIDISSNKLSKPINDLKTNGGKEFKDIKENLLLKKFKYTISRG